MTIIDRWPYEISALTFEEIHRYIKDDEWQRFRRSLKGKSTKVKLETLQKLRSVLTGGGKFELDRANQVRIDNYLNALKRGGQLDSNGIIVR